MKNSIYALCLIAAVGTAACGDNNIDFVAPHTLEVREAVVDFYSMGGDGSITLADGSNDITANSDVDWCNITGTSDRVISYTVLPNKSLQTRTAKVNITTQQANVEIAITQAGFIVDFELSDFNSYPDNVAFDRRIKFSSELPTSAQVSTDAAGWLAYEKTTGGYIVSAATNDSGHARLGKVTLTSGEIIRTYTFLQYGLKDLCREWNASYQAVAGEETTDILSITQSEGNGLTIDFTTLKYKGVKAYYENGALKIPCGQFMGIENNYELYLGILSASGMAGIEPTITFQMKPYLQQNGKWGLALDDDGSYEEPISALAVWATAKGEIAGYWDLFGGLTLSY